MSIEDRDGRQEARDDRQEARDDRQAARDARALFTRDDLDPLAVQVVALREDLAAYRWAIERVLKRRYVTSIAASILGVVGLLTLVGGVQILIDAEEERSARTLEIARLESCASVRNLQAQVAGVLASLPPSADGPRPWLPDAIDRLSVDPCVPPQAPDAP